MSTVGLLRSIWNHPANRDRRVRAVFDSIRWQCYKRLWNRPANLPYHGLILRCYPDSHSASGAIYFAGMPDYREMSFIKDYLHPGDKFIDVGANVGLYSLLARSRVGPTGQVHSFEPMPETADRLQEALQINELTNVVLHRVAASDSAGTVCFDRTDDSCTAHVAQNAKPAAGPAEIATVRLDEYLPDDNYAMAKFDIEGYEPFALRGMTRLLAQGNPPVMQIELAGYSKRYGVTSTDFVQELKRLGYDTGYYVPESRSIVFTQTPWTVPVENILAIHRDRLPQVLDRLASPDRPH